MDDIEKILTEAPLTINDEERKHVESLAIALDASAHSGSPGIMVTADPFCAAALHVVILAGLRAIDEGLIGYEGP